MMRGVGCALLAAALFGASTPLAKLLAGQLTPALLAGLLYAGSGIGLGAWLLIRTARARPASCCRAGVLRPNVLCTGGYIAKHLFYCRTGNSRIKITDAPAM